MLLGFLRLGRVAGKLGAKVLPKAAVHLAAGHCFFHLASVIGGEILRIGRACPAKESFFETARIVLEKMMRQGAHVKELTKILKETFGRHDELKKFAVNLVDFVSSLL